MILSEGPDVSPQLATSTPNEQDLVVLIDLNGIDDLVITIPAEYFLLDHNSILLILDEKFAIFQYDAVLEMFKIGLEGDGLVL